MSAPQVVQRRTLILGAIVIVAALVAASDALHARSQDLLALTERLIERYPLLGMTAFVLLAMASAMLAFFSSAILVPVGVYAWGVAGCLALLWLGWLLGGMAAFAVGKYLGRAVVARLIGEDRVGRFEQRLSGQLRFGHILLFQLTLPSEIPGYVLGTLNYRFWLFVAGVAIAELPYAVGTIYLGSMFLQRQAVLLLLLGLAAVLLSAVVYRAYRRARTGGPPS